MMATFLYFPILCYQGHTSCRANNIIILWNEDVWVRVSKDKRLALLCVDVVLSPLSLSIYPFTVRWRQLERSHRSINRTLGQRWETRRGHEDNLLVVVVLVFGILLSWADKPVKQKAERLDWRRTSDPRKSIDQKRIDWWNLLFSHRLSHAFVDEEVISLNDFAALI